jgi:O-antigen/teichoic acid export membrane protein
MAQHRTTAQWALAAASANVVGRLVPLLAWFFLTPLVLHHLGTRGFGVWAVIGSLVGYLSLFDAGLGAAITRFVALHQARGDTGSVHLTATSGFRLTLFLGALCFGVTVALAPLFGGLFGARFGVVAILVGAGIAVGLPATVPVVVLRGLGRFDLASAVGIAGTGLFAICVLFVLEMGYGLVGLVAVDAPVTATTALLALKLLRRVEPELQIVIGKTDRATMGELLRFGLPLLLANASEQLNAQSDELVIATLMSVESVTPYTLARRVSELPRLLAEPFVRVILPPAAAATGDAPRQRAIYLTTTRVTGGILGITASALGPLAGAFLAAWTGTSLGHSEVIARLLLIAVVVDTSLWPLGALLQGIGRHRVLPVIACGAAVLNLVLSVALIGPFGPVGVALATLIVAIAASVALVPIAARLVGFNPLDTVRALWPAIVAAVPAAATSVGLVHLFAPRTLVGVATLGSVSAVVFTLAYLSLPPTRQERDLIRSLVRRR